VTGGLGHSNL